MVHKIIILYAGKQAVHTLPLCIPSLHFLKPSFLSRTFPGTGQLEHCNEYTGMETNSS